MNNFISIPTSLKPDADGFTGRECPVKECQGYFKVQFGTGLEGNVPCHCPYCGHIASHDHFWTKDQIEYAKSVAVQKVSSMFTQELQKIERCPNPRALFDISIKIDGNLPPLYLYQEKKLEQEVICDSCTLRYSIYGVFGYCPDCGIHNSFQILNANLNIVEKILNFSNELEEDIAKKIIENCLESIVSIFDGFGREFCKIYDQKTTASAHTQNISFQNISMAKDKLRELFKIDISNSLDASDWKSLIYLFQKRHLIAHKMGVIDQKYINQTNENSSLIGRKVIVTKEDILQLTKMLRQIGNYLVSHIK